MGCGTHGEELEKVAGQQCIGHEDELSNYSKEGDECRKRGWIHS